MIWLPKFYIEELEQDECLLLGLDTTNNAKWKALAVEWFNKGWILYAKRIYNNENDDNDSGLLCATGKCCC